MRYTFAMSTRSTSYSKTWGLNLAMLLPLLAVGCSESSTGSPGQDAGDTSEIDGGSDPDANGEPQSGLLPPSISPVLTYCPFTDASDLAQFEGRTVVRVCHSGDARSGCDVNTLADALSQVSSGERIEIVGDGAPYNQCGVIPATLSDVEIVGVCGRPHLQNKVCQSKGTFLNLGRDISISNIEVSDATISEQEGRNGAAVRDQGLGNLNLSYVYFHNNQNGILGGKGVIRIDWSRFEANGTPLDPGFTHNTYFSADVDNVIINYSLFLRAQNEGNNMKSRAKRMEFHCSVSASLDGVDSREMDISEGGELIITNSLFEQGAVSANSNIIGFATEANNPDRRHEKQSIVIRDTDIINDRSGGSFVAYNAFNSFSMELENVRFVGSGEHLRKTNDGVESNTESGSETFSDRSGAGLPAYSDDHMQLPMPRGCPGFEYF